MGSDNTKAIYENELINPIIRWGRFTNILACILAFSPAVYLAVFWNAIPPISAVVHSSLATILGFSAVFWFVEPISYFPILGIPGTYMGFLSGNISNMRVPCSIMAQSAAEVEEGTMAGSVISVLGVGMSIIVNMIVMFVGAFAGAQIIAACPVSVKNAFAYILPAVFGGVFGQFAPKNFKIAAFALIIGCVCVKSSFLPVYIAIPLCIFLTIFAGIKTHNRQPPRHD